MASRNNYQHSTSPRKIEIPYSNKKQAIDNRKRKKTNLQTRKKPKKMSKFKTISLVLICFAVLFVVGYRNAKIDEDFATMQSLKAQLETLEKETEQLKVRIEGSLNLSCIEEVAREKLGMQKLDNKQKIYLHTPKREYIQPVSERIEIANESWFTEIFKMIKNIF